MTRQKAETAVDGVHAALETDIYVFSLLKRSKLNFLFFSPECNIIRCQDIRLALKASFQNFNFAIAPISLSLHAEGQKILKSPDKKTCEIK